MASAWKPAVIRPVAIMPVTKYWVNLTPSPIVPLKIEPNTRIMIAGNASVNMTCSRLRMNCRISSPPCASPSSTGPVRRAEAMSVVTDHLQVDVLEGRAGHGQPGHLARETHGQVGHDGRRRRAAGAFPAAVGRTPGDRRQRRVAPPQRSRRVDGDQPPA